jgi:hypothetical protein
MEFRKFDGGKNRPDLIPVEFLAGVGSVLQYGAEKYGENNWTAGTQWSRVAGALLRHYLLWAAGEDYDQESGLHHLFHV